MAAHVESSVESSAAWQSARAFIAGARDCALCLCAGVCGFASIPPTFFTLLYFPDRERFPWTEEQSAADIGHARYRLFGQS
jgi:hypothetical protein